MFFRNLVFFRYPMACIGLFPLQEALAECALKPVGPLELASRGFVAPMGRGEEDLVVECGDCRWITVGGEGRVLPAAVVNELLARKLAEIEKKEGRAPLGRARKRIKDDLLVQLIPQALVAPSRTDAYLDLGRGLLVVDTSSRKTGESIVSEIRRALGSFPCLPLNAEVAPRSVLTGWLAGEAMPEGWSLGEECELRDALTNGAVVKIQNEQLSGDEIAQHLSAGKQCTRLAINFEDHLEFVLGEDLVIRKLKFLDGVVDELENKEHEDLQAELNAQFALMTGELGRLFDSWSVAFKLSRADEGQVAPTVTGVDLGSGDATVIARVADGVVTVIETNVAPAAPDDPLYPQAVALVRESGRVSISHVQRVLKIGYNRGARLVEAMEEHGVVSVQSYDGTRTVLPVRA